ncbi:CAP domain-containing protein [Candidatus Parcubacteria bacterium]|nr:MAG: CAP domain-containing protein [Candidatus Parcubacteria bacterium]
MKDFFYHLFIPYHKNNHRSKILHVDSLLIIFLFLLSFGLSLIALKSARPDILGVSYSLSENELLVLTNNARQEKNLPSLIINQELTEAAQKKALHMFEKDYWAHFAPDGTSPWDFLKEEDYSYLYAGENLAKGFSNTQDVVQAWMNSPTHRDNILSDKFQEVGFAIVKGRLKGEDTVLIVEMFGSQNLQAYNVKRQANNNLIPQPKQNVMGKTENNNVSSYIPANNIFSQPIMDISIPSKTIPLFVLFVLLVVLTIDLAVIERKKIPRLVGHNVDHIMLISIFILYLLFIGTGGIL